MCNDTLIWEDFSTVGLFSETFQAAVEGQSVLSAGHYQYLCDGQLLGINESWQKHRLPDGSILVSSIRDAPMYGSRMWVQSRSVGDAINEFKVQWQQTNDDGLFISDAHYLIGKEQTRVERLYNGQSIVSKHRINRKNIVVSPLMRVYVGDTINRLSSLGGRATVLMPRVQEAADFQRRLELQLSERSVSCIDNNLSNEAMAKWRCYNYKGDQYDDSALFWLNDEGMLARYCWRQNKLFWQVNLEQFNEEKSN